MFIYEASSDYPPSSTSSTQLKRRDFEIMIYSSKNESVVNLLNQ